MINDAISEAPSHTGSLSVVGSGIRLSQLTVEARAAIDRADKLFFLVADPITFVWINSLRDDAEDLHTSYSEGRPRKDTYAEMVARILEQVRAGLAVCVLSYGHPGVFAYPMHESVRQARAAGFVARMYPGISAEDCLFADLGVDPGERGCQSFEATDFLVYRRKADPACPLILWQVGVTGDLGYKENFSLDGMAVLVDVLMETYDPLHPVVLYEAATYAASDGMVHRTSLNKLMEAPVTPISTLYVLPPTAPSVPDIAMLTRLGLQATMLRAKV